MLQFVDVKQETPEKEIRIREKMILTKSTKIISLIRQPNNLADVLSVEYPFVKSCPLSNNIPDYS